MGLLDFLTGNNAAASPYGALYQTPDQASTNDFLRALLQGGQTGVATDPNGPFGDPSKLSAVPAGPLPAPSPFGDPGKLSIGLAPSAVPGSGAAPFGFAPSMATVSPSQVAAPSPPAAPPAQPAPVQAAPAPVAPPVAAAPPARPTPAPVPADDEEDTTPANATPTAGALPAASATLGTPSPAPFSLGGAADSIGSRLGAGFRGFAANAQTGPVGAVLGGIAGLAGMGQPTTAALQKQAATATGQALLSKNANPLAVQAAVASAAAGNNAPLASLFNQYFGPDKFQHVTQKDQFGGETSGAFDPTTGKTVFQGAPGTGAASPSGGVQSMIDTITQKREAGASRADLIKEIPPAYQGYVSGLLDGKAIPANIGRGAARGALMTIAHTIDPTFDETMIPARIQTAKDFTPQGKSGASIVAFNTVQHHIGKLSDDFEALGNAGQGGFQAINAIRNGLASQTPIDPVRQKAVQAVNDDLKAVSDEMSAAYKAGHVSDTEIKSWNSLVNSNLPLNQARQAISDFVDLLNGKRDALNKVHQQIMGGDAAIIDKDENSTITQKVHARNSGMTSGSASNAGTAPGAISEGATATNPKTGARIVFKGGQWVPVQ